MNLRFYTVYLALLSLTEIASAAGNGAWNCEQGKNGEWTCLNQGGQPPAKPQAEQAKTVQSPQPSKAAAEPPTQAAPPQPAQAATPAPTQATESPKQPEVAATEQNKTHVRMTENQKPVVEKLPPRSAQPAPAAAKNSGWACKSGEEKNWNCNLVGPDPKGEAQAVAETQPANSWLTPTFNHQQERTFQVLRGEFAQDPWQNCSNWSSKKRKLKSPSQAIRDEATTDVDADFSEIFDGEVMNFAGNVDLRRADQHLLADKASYDTVAETMDAQGNVIYSESVLALSSDSVSLSMGKDEARLRRAQFIAAEAPLRGTADVVYRDSKTLSRYHDATFTSCPPGNQDWIAHASRLKINRETGIGSAKHAWLEFKSVPVMYLPYISFPVDNRRVSGLLAPTWGSTQRNGFDVTAPFYWNIAPNFDDVITPRYMAKRGGMLRNKFRYMTETSKGSLAGEILPYDQLKDKSRYSVSFKDQSIFTPHLQTNTDLNYVSDKEYFNDLNNALGFQTSSYLPSTAYINYGRPDISFSAGMQHYQSVDKTITDAAMPYDILPRVNLNLGHNFETMPLNLALDNQFSHFYHTDLVNGQRVNIAPSVSLPLEASAGFFIPKITGQYTQYQLSNQSNPNLPSSVNRMLPIFSVDSGMTFERDLNLGGSGYTNTLEPRAFYLYIPRKDQTEIPIFDTSTYDTNFYSLFRENRFSGLDRVQDANQITLAGTTRFIDAETGLEPLKLSLGQILYFQDRTVDLYDKNNPNSVSIPVQDSSTSNFIGELSGQISRHLSYSTGAQWDPEENGIARGQAVLKFRNQPNQLFDVGYRYRRSTPNNQSTSNTAISALNQTISQSDVSFRWPLFAEWYGLGRWQYSFNFGKTTESFIGLEKENCCWRLRLIGRRYINGANSTNILAPDAKPETAFFVQLELKGFTSFGDSVDQFLETNLNGYRKSNYFE